MRKKSLYILLIPLIAWSCYPGGVQYYEETDVVYTEYDEEFDFSSRRTYAMPDSVVKVTGNIIEGEPPEFIKEPYNTEIIDRIKSNMSANGWDLVDDPADADLVLFPAAWTNTTIYYWYNYWCWYYPWYCGWGWYPSFTSVTTGTLLMTMVVDGEEYVEPTTVWTSAVNGLLSGAQNTNRINNAIDQAFAQSPYLKVN